MVQTKRKLSEIEEKLLQRINKDNVLYIDMYLPRSGASKELKPSNRKCLVLTVKDTPSVENFVKYIKHVINKTELEEIENLEINLLDDDMEDTSSYVYLKVPINNMRSSSDKNIEEYVKENIRLIEM